jgi:hypothetical protein
MANEPPKVSTYHHNEDLEVDPRFYLKPRIEIDGHLYRIIMTQHHPECPCRQKKEDQITVK